MSFFSYSKSFSSKYHETGSCVAAGESSAARAMSDMIPNLQEDDPETGKPVVKNWCYRGRAIVAQPISKG
jgi:hypothetical protein